MAEETSTRPSFTPVRRWSVGFNLLVRTLAVLAVLGFVNHLAGVFFHRQYLSQATKVELSERTRKVLAAVTNHVEVAIYYDRDDEFYPTIAALLREYQAVNPLVQVRTVDYLRDAGEALQLKKEFSLPDEIKETGKNFVLFKCGAARRLIPGEFLTDTVVGRDQKTGQFIRRPTAFKGETAFTAMILGVASPAALKAYVLQGHGEHNIDGPDEVTGYLDFKSLLQQNAIQVEALSLLGTNVIPADCNLLIVPGPTRPIPEGELKKVEQYLDEGGSLLALFNSQVTEAMGGLEPLLARKWGVVVTDSVVVDPTHSISTIKSAPGADVTLGVFSTHPVVKGLINYQLNLLAPRLIGERAGRETSADAPVVNILFQTEPTASLVNNPSVPPQRFTLAVAVEKRPVPGIITTRGNTRMIIVGDSFFLANGAMKNYAIANRDFAHYAINWLLGRPQFTEGIGPKPFSEYRIVLTETEMARLRWLLLGALPGGILLFGVLVWWRRRK